MGPPAPLPPAGHAGGTVWPSERRRRQRRRRLLAADEAGCRFCGHRAADTPSSVPIIPGGCSAAAAAASIFTTFRPPFGVGKQVGAARTPRAAPTPATAGSQAPAPPPPPEQAPDGGGEGGAGREGTAPPRGAPQATVPSLCPSTRPGRPPQSALGPRLPPQCLAPPPPPLRALWDVLGALKCAPR